MLEIRGVRRSRRPHDDRRLALSRRRHRAQRAQQQLRIVVDPAHPVGAEQLRQQLGHRRAILEHVRDARRDPHVVLDHLPRAVAVAHQVAPGDVCVDAARRADPVHGPRKVRAGRHQAPRHEALADDLASVVHVVDEMIQRADPLGEPALDLTPFLAAEHARDQIEWKRAFVREPALAARLERDALLHEHRVAPAARLQ